ncbi:hypothetical protein O3M35_008536 [Rhynocoris fuscipes]|uniref:Uncharacterized protein n=1 Tax=Rhynocoris fuscipes TaxID=488301 RepID=A0AAW1D7A4_9HEMI
MQRPHSSSSEGKVLEKGAMGERIPVTSLTGALVTEMLECISSGEDDSDFSKEDIIEVLENSESEEEIVRILH